MPRSTWERWHNGLMSGQLRVWKSMIQVLHMRPCIHRQRHSGGIQYLGSPCLDIRMSLEIGRHHWHGPRGCALQRQIKLVPYCGKKLTHRFYWNGSLTSVPLVRRVTVSHLTRWTTLYEGIGFHGFTYGRDLEVFGAVCWNRYLQAFLETTWNNTLTIF